MKRVITALVMIVFILGIGFYSMFKIKGVRNDMIMYIDAITQAVEEENLPLVQQSVEELCFYWEKQERSLVHFIRHTQIDDLTKNVARLPAVAAYQNYLELFAELSSIRWQVEHIWNTEKPVLDNILFASL